MLDLEIFAFGHIAKIEIKDPDKPPSQRQLTASEAEILAYAEQGYPIYVVMTVEDVVDVLADLANR